jgi:triacylglycerol lipase
MMNVVFIHGILDTGHIFKRMRTTFEASGIHCLAPSLKPRDGRTGLDRLAEDLMQQIDAEFGTDEPISIVGFSMGSIVGRYYIQELGGHDRVKQYFSIAGPHRGSIWSFFYPGRGARHMRPGSTFLKNLNDSASEFDGMECHAYWTPFDLMIVPQHSALLPFAENHRVLSWCHPCLLINPHVMNDIRDKVINHWNFV